jgi:hypothetical protein
VVPFSRIDFEISVPTRSSIHQDSSISDTLPNEAAVVSLSGALLLEQSNA